MVFNKLSYYELENKCYGLKQSNINLTDLSLDLIIDSSFIQQTYTYQPSTSTRKYYSECEELAIKNNKDFFLLTNATSDGTYVKYSCLVPKTNKICDLSNLENLFEPFNQLLRDLLNIENPPTINTTTPQSSSEIATLLLSDTNNINTCFTISNDNIDNIDNTDTLAKKRHFILYKTQLININNDDIINNLRNVKSVDHYRREYNNIYFDNLLSLVTNSFQEYLCGSRAGTDSQFQNLNTNFNDLNNEINRIDNLVDDIARDISYISLTTNYDTLYLKQIVDNINTEKNKLNNLLGFDGANNGKLHDTNFMKNIKISEICILFIIMIFIIFIYSKKK